MKTKLYTIYLIAGLGSTVFNPDAVRAQNTVSNLDSALVQDCNHPMGLTKNTEFVYQVTDRGKNDGTLSNKVMQQAMTPEGEFVTTVKSARINNKKRPETAEEFTIRCKGDTVYLDAILLLREQAQKTFSGKELEYTPTDLAYPHQMEVGQKLPDGKLLVRVRNSVSDITHLQMSAINRKVEGKQQITTPAGTFDSYRISYQYIIKLNTMGVNIEDVYQVEEYYSTENGIVKLQFTNKKGKKGKGIELITKKNPVQAFQR
ncbi:TapB family protein [Rufibacter roseus]|uniref:DUF3108 domain-containing protein n=1 Tax=Rufibacter roseus TaxID=1567108 RepID=A0ABW2DSQ3_9BACT|nr:hypothetical protein [Rufibacter roseus]